MTKRRFFIPLLAMFVFFCLRALADGPVDPSMSQMRKQMQQINRLISEDKHEQTQPSDDELRAVASVHDDNNNVSISMSTENPKPTNTVTFRANVSGVSSGTALEYKWSIQDENRDSGGFLYWPQHDETELSQTSIRYKFYSPGKYRCNLLVYRKNSSELIGYDIKTFTIESDGVHPSMEQKAQEIVNQCKASTNWQTALNLYDWLTHHAYYDSTRCFHGADIIFYGYGVCDSYSKAYELLCKTAGITIERAFGPNHAWNTLVLGGKWYQVDATWDDPNSWKPGEGKLVSGNEGHQFFCLSSEIMQGLGGAHKLDEGTHATECTSMDGNFYIHENLWQPWGDYYTPWVDQIANAFGSGQTIYEFRAEIPYQKVDGSIKWAGISYPEITNGIMRSGLTRYAFTLFGDKIKISVISNSSYVITVKLKGWDMTETGTLKLPASLKRVPVSGFERILSTTVVIPKGCTSIESKAFYKSSVRTITIPSSVVWIASDAFSECGKIIVKAEAGTYAADYAAQQGMIVINP